ncbi:hypothetical protein GGI43DRAFT_431416 [Trichoderma evansii]
MKFTTALLLSSTIILPTANAEFQWQPITDEPQFKYDPGTISPCIVCFRISPEDFHKWNPSVGLDYKPWNVKSYCVVSEGRLASFIATASKEASTSSKSAAETASSKTGPITTGSKTAAAITTFTQSSGGPAIATDMACSQSTVCHGFEGSARLWPKDLTFSFTT